MGLQEQYKKRKKELINDKKICKANRDLFNEFFKFQEYKLKRINGLPKIDNGCYKTLLSYIQRLRNVDNWFNHKDWTKLTKKEIKKVYDDLEDNKIKNSRGQPVKDKKGYYFKIFKGKPFKLAGKNEISNEVMEFYNHNTEEQVRFFPEETFKDIVEVVNTPKQKLLLWLAWDIGENISTLLELQKKDFIKQIDKDTKQPEYIVKLYKEKLKRSRTARSEPTNYTETTKYLDFVLKDLKDEDKLFHFGHRQALKFLQRAVKITNSKCIEGQKPTWKDFRSSMACHLLDRDWTTDEIKSRLGHKPSSRVLDKYVTYKALKKKPAKKKLYENDIEELKSNLEETERQAKLSNQRHRENSEKFKQQEKEIEGLKEMIKHMK